MVISLAIYLGAYILLLFLVSWWISRNQSEEDFLISGRNRKGWQIFSSKFAAAIGAGWFITYTGFAYEFGTGVFTLLIGLILGYIIFAYWAAPKIHKNSKIKKFYTSGHFIYDRLKNKSSMFITDICMSAIAFSWLIVAIIGGGKIISDFGFLSYIPAVILTSAVVLGYLLIAGHKGVIVTDIIQSIIIAILLVVITFGIIGSGSVGELLSVQTGNIDLGIAIGFLLYGILSVFSSADRYQLAYAAENARKLKHGLGLAVIPIILAACLLLLIGLFMALNSPGIDPALAFTEALKDFLPLSLLPLAIVLFFAGIMSSVDTGIYAISSHYALHRSGNPVLNIRKATFALVIILALFAILFPNIIDVSVVAGGITLTISFAMVYAIMGGSNSGRFIFSIAGGFVGLVLGLWFLGITPTIALPVLVGGIIGLIFRSKE